MKKKDNYIKKMSGLRKAKKYDWKDSNMALFGSDTEKQVKKESAETEPAWHGSGQTPGLQIWRIVKFRVESWPKEDYGKFYNGDSYIILNTYKEPNTDELKYDLHFWIGKYSTQDEYGTAAYKTVELDTYHDDKPIQHREVEGHESQLFKSYFPAIEILKGGAETGFRHVAPEEYTPRLLHFRKEGKTVTLKEVPRSKDYLKDDDVFILDMGVEIYQWNGRSCSKDEKFKAQQHLQHMKSERSGRCRTETLDQDDISERHKFYDALDEDVDSDEEGDDDSNVKLFKVSDADGSLDMDLVKEDQVRADDLNGDDVFICDFKNDVYIWIGENASPAENRNAMAYAHNYVKSTPHPFSHIAVVRQGAEPPYFRRLVAGMA